MGLTAAQLGEELVSLGCVRAICLDGGGSSAMALRRPGESTASLITSPSDGSQRACANYIFFINHVTSDNVTAYAFLTPSYRYVLPGASTWFSVKGADASYGPAPDPSGMSYTVSGDLGTVENQTFTAGTATGTATITASNGSVEGSMDICITGDVNSIGLQSAGKDISSISVKPGQDVYKRQALTYDREAIYTALLSDKKKFGATVNFILVREAGRAEITPIDVETLHKYILKL